MELKQLKYKGKKKGIIFAQNQENKEKYNFTLNNICSDVDIYCILKKDVTA